MQMNVRRNHDAAVVSRSRFASDERCTCLYVSGEPKQAAAGRANASVCGHSRIELVSRRGVSRKETGR
jgi:hypothetical protein